MYATPAKRTRNTTAIAAKPPGFDSAPGPVRAALEEGSDNHWTRESS